MFTLIDRRTPVPRTFVIARPTLAGLGRSFSPFTEAIGVFARAHSDDQIYRQRTFELEPFVREGRLMLILTAPRFEADAIAGVTICVEDDEHEGLFEVSMTVVDPAYRRIGLGTALAGAAAVQECAEAEVMEGIVFVTREDNSPCRHAAGALGAPVRGAIETLEVHPQLMPRIKDIQSRMLANHRTQQPLFSVLPRRALKSAARMLLQARSPGGFALKHGARLVIGPGFEHDDLFDQVAEIAAGWAPRTKLWGPSGGRLSA
jgi:GNAT superfamily N-acetyltransferase